MARKTKEEAEKTYCALLDAAITLFGKQGVSNTTLNDIAKQAGMTRGAVYWHFENKDAVIKAIWGEYAQVEINKFMDAIAHLPDTDPLGYFQGHLTALLRQVFTDKKLNQSMRIIHSSREFTDKESDLQLFFKNHHKNYHRGLLDAVKNLQQREAFNPNLSADFIATGIRIFVLGLMETQLEIREVEMVNQCEAYIDVFISAFK